MTTHRDSSGRPLTEYPRPSVAVDTAVLTITADGDLCVLLVRTGASEGWRLPGTFLHEGETLADAVRRSLREKAGVEGLRPQQLHVFDDPDRDERGRVLSVAHLDVVPLARLAVDPDRTRLVDAREPGTLPYDHERIVDRALRRVRAAYREAPDPEGLLAEPFTLRDLLRLHEAVEGAPLQRDSFRRRVIGDLDETGDRLVGAVGKPPRLFRRRRV